MIIREKHQFMQSKSYLYISQKKRVMLFISILLFILTCIFFITDKHIIFFNFNIYSFTSTGLLGVSTVFTYGLYTAIKGRPELSLVKHLSFSLLVTLITIDIYFVIFSITIKYIVYISY